MYKSYKYIFNKVSNHIKLCRLECVCVREYRSVEEFDFARNKHSAERWSHSLWEFGSPSGSRVAQDIRILKEYTAGVYRGSGWEALQLHLKARLSSFQKNWNRIPNKKQRYQVLFYFILEIRMLSTIN